MYGDIADFRAGNAILIIRQLFVADVIVICLDELLQKGYGMGYGTSLSVVTNICENIAWKALRPSAMNTEKETEFEEAVIALFHLLTSKGDKISAFKSAFTS